MTGAPRGTLAFDLDGTLIDSAPSLASSLGVLLREMKIEPTSITETRQLIGNGIPVLVKRALESRQVALDSEKLAAAIERFMRIYEDRLLDETRLYPNVERNLQRFAGEGWRLAICTNKAERLTRRILDGLGLLHVFSVVTGPETFNCAKPSPQILSRTIEAAAAAGKPAILIGDSEIDIATAKAASVPVIAVTYGYCKTPIAELRPDGLVDDFDELPAVVARIAGNARPYRRRSDASAYGASTSGGPMSEK